MMTWLVSTSTKMIKKAVPSQEVVLFLVETLEEQIEIKEEVNWR
jgi:hypothetical protein